jgi:inosose dehydratase
MHHHHTNTLAETMEESELLLAEVPSKNFFCFCDTGHATKDFIRQPIKERALGFLERNWPRVRYIECKDWTAATEFSTDLGRGDANFAAIFPLLHERNYSGWITVEQNSPSAGSTPAECARRAFEFLSKHLNATLEEKTA